MIKVEFFGCFGAAQLNSAQLPVMSLKHRKAPVTPTQFQDPAPGMADHAGRLEDQLMHQHLDALSYVTHQRVGLIQCVLSDPAQQIHRHYGELAHQIVGVEFSTGQTLLIHVGFKFRVKLLVRNVITVQLNYLSSTECLGLCHHPAFQGLLRQKQRMPMLVDAPLCQALNPAHRAMMAVYAVQRQRFSPQPFALTGGLAHPRSAGVSVSSHSCCGNVL